jgi:methionine-gamma-lyase
MSFKPANNIQDLQYFGEFGGVNPSISDSSTYTFLSAKTMFDTFEGNADGCYLYSRHSSPSNLYLGEALAAMEGTETANVALKFYFNFASLTIILYPVGPFMVARMPF